MHDSIRLLEKKWVSNVGWPQRLESIEISGIRGWTGKPIPFQFPIVAISGENGSGKSTILQAAAASFRAPKGGRNITAGIMFPETMWDSIADAMVHYFRVRTGVELTMPAPVWP